MGFRAPSAEDVYRYAMRLDEPDRSLTDRFGFSIIFVNDSSPVCTEFLRSYFVDLCHRTADRIRFIFFAELDEQEVAAAAEDLNRRGTRSGGLLNRLLRLAPSRSRFDSMFATYSSWEDLRPSSLHPAHPENTFERLAQQLLWNRFGGSISVDRTTITEIVDALTSGWGVRFVFASATFPRFLQKLIQALIPCAVIEPDLTEEGDREVVERKRHNLRIADGNVMTALDNMCADTFAGKSVLVVCNHVRTAQIIYEALATRLVAAGLHADDIVLFHSRFNMEDRSRIEQTLGKKPLPKVLVATQVVEVSLDIDFDCGYLEPAPIDAMIQRMGRVNRKGSRNPEPIVVFREPVGAYPIYQTAIVGRTVEALSTLSNPLSEHDVVAACDRVSDEVIAPMRRGLKLNR